MKTFQPHCLIFFTFQSWIPKLIGCVKNNTAEDRWQARRHCKPGERGPKAAIKLTCSVDIISVKGAGNITSSRDTTQIYILKRKPQS